MTAPAARVGGGAPSTARALCEAGRIVFQTRDFERLPEAIVRVSMDVLSADAVTLLLPGLDETFYVAHAFGLSPEVARSTRVVVGEGVAGRVALSRTPLLIAGDASQHAALQGVTARKRVRSSIVYPLVLGDEVRGILTFNRLTDDAPFQAADLDTAAVLASQVLLALENSRLARQAATTERLAAIGQLAAGIAHEINTPTQYVCDSLDFLSEAFADVLRLVDRYEAVAKAAGRAGEGAAAMPDALAEARALSQEIDFPYLRDAVPKALTRTADGASRITKVVQAVKAFGRPDCRDKVPADLNDCLVSTITVASGEYKHVADVETDFGALPPLSCHPGELNQVFLNLLVNAAHAIADAVAGTQGRGRITVRTRSDAGDAVVAIEDTGTGIPAEVQASIFDPFFTTKAVGKGTGLGLSVARSIVEKHGGSISVQSEPGRGSRFTVRVPFEPLASPDARGALR